MLRLLHGRNADFAASPLIDLVSAKGSWPASFSDGENPTFAFFRSILWPWKPVKDQLGLLDGLTVCLLPAAPSLGAGTPVFVQPANAGSIAGTDARRPGRKVRS